MEVVQISAELRSEFGKKATKAVRKEGKIPAVMYSSNGVHHFSTNKKAVKSLVFTADLKMAEITLDGKTYKSLLKDIDFHPVTDEIIHMDFLELVPKKSIKVNIPVKTKGESPGVKIGGTLMTSLRTVKVITTPEALVHELFVDISSLELSEAVRVKDIETPDGLVIDVDPAIPVAIVDVPRALKGEDEEEEVVEETPSEEATTEG